MACQHYKISGKVQGVFFRAEAKKRADELGIIGWVRNAPNESVECVACGEHDKLELFCQWLHQGPAHAEVKAVEVSSYHSEEDFADFRVAD